MLCLAAGKLLELQKSASGDTPFYPDANSTLRISAGHVEGYRAADAVFHTPITTLKGLLDKHEDAALTCSESDGPGEFDCPRRLVHMLASDVNAQAVPCNVLYSTDTVGGNR
jgi:hypothetical protein|eukprot:COSAG03_NODE_3_length_28214_cov_23.750987_11_plen_112_part_00